MKMSPQEFLRRKIFRLQPSHDIGFFDFPLEPPHTLVYNNDFCLYFVTHQKYHLAYKPCGQNFDPSPNEDPLTKWLLLSIFIIWATLPPPSIVQVDCRYMSLMK